MEVPGACCPILPGGIVIGNQVGGGVHRDCRERRLNLYLYGHSRVRTEVSDELASDERRRWSSTLLQSALQIG